MLLQVLVLCGIRPIWVAVLLQLLLSLGSLTQYFDKDETDYGQDAARKQLNYNRMYPEIYSLKKRKIK